MIGDSLSYERLLFIFHSYSVVVVARFCYAHFVILRVACFLFPIDYVVLPSIDLPSVVSLSHASFVI